MEVKYDIPQYIVSTKMSAKTRILVEGKEDKSHISNLLCSFSSNNRIKIDTAESIRGNDAITAKNNRAKLDKIHTLCDYLKVHKNFFILRDREYYKFTLTPAINDEMRAHECDGNLSWTIGHSLENYFFKEQIMAHAYRFLSICEFKNDAMTLFSKNFTAALKISSSISLSAKNLDKVSYPIGVISWRDFTFSDETLQFDINSWKPDDKTLICDNFKTLYNKSHQIIDAAELDIVRKVGRGHTVMIFLQRIFSACMYHCGKKIDNEKAMEYADDFSKIKESLVSGALGEAWIRSIKDGNEDYPINLVSAVLPSEIFSKKC